MSYTPLARKYRPQRFDALIGQPHVTATLTRALESQRVAQAYLFAGTRGVGKTSAARILAKCLNCDQGPTASPCDACANCTGILRGSSLDVIEIDGASNRGIDEIRSLREGVAFAPTTGRFRVYIIDEVHMLTTEAFNALLKTLEEPPAHVKFIFATTAAAKVPPTILSRCQRFDFRRIDAATAVGVLTRLAEAERIAIGEPALYAIAHASDGSLRDAEVILEQLSSFVAGTIEEADVAALLGAVESETLAGLTQAILDRHATQALALLQQQVEQGKDAPQLLAGLLRQFRNLLVIRSAQDAPGRGELLERLVDEPAERRARLEQQATGATTQELLLLLQVLSGAYELIRRSPMGQMVLELVLIKLATREQWQSIEDITRRLEALSAGGAPPSSGRAAPATPPRAATASEPARPVSTAGGTLEQLAAAWPVLLERVGAQKMSLAAYLADSRPLRLEGATLTVGVPGFALHHEVLSLPDHRRLITSLLGELSPGIATVQYETLPAAESAVTPSAAPAAGPAAPPLVQDIVNLFNATLLDRPRPTP